MKIRVQHKDGTMETLSLVPSIAVFDKGGNLSHLACGDGTDHYFDLDGYYDGWGRGVCGLDEQAAKEVIASVEQSREQESPGSQERKP